MNKMSLPQGEKNSNNIEECASILFKALIRIIKMKLPLYARMSITLNLSRLCLLLLPITITMGNGIGDIVFSLTTMLATLEIIQRRDISWLKHSWVKAAFCLWAYMIGRSLFSTDPWQALNLTLPFIRFPLFAALVPVIWHPRMLKPFLYIWLTALFLLSSNILFKHIMGHDIFGQIAQECPYPFAKPDYSNYRIGTTLLWLGLPIILFALMKRRFIPMMIAIITIASIYYSGEAIPLGLLFLGIVMAILCLPCTMKRYAIFGGIFCSIVLLILMRHSDNITDTWQKLPISYSKFTETPYGQAWQTGMALAKAHHIFGIGPIPYQASCNAYMSFKPETQCASHLYHYYLEWLSEYGFVGFSLFLLMSICWLQIIRQLWPTMRLDPLWIGGIVLIILKLLPLAVATSFFTNWTAILFWFTLGWSLAISRQSPLPH